jgi:hypothetical protein
LAFSVQQPLKDSDDPTVEHGVPPPAVDEYRVGVGAITKGLIPPLSISTEPNGIPAWATPPGDVVADVAAPPLEVGTHGPAVAALPGDDVPVTMAIPPPS